MQVNEIEVKAAREQIAAEFMNRYYEFIEDVPKGTTMEFGKKYGFVFREAETAAEHTKDTMKNLLYFKKHVFDGRWLPDWQKAGFDKYVIWQLHKDGFLSCQEYSNWNARMTGHTQFYYISQKVAKEIYKEYRR